MYSQISKSFLFALNNSMKRQLPLHPSVMVASSRQLTTATSNAVHKLQAAVEQYRVQKYVSSNKSTLTGTLSCV
jgi:hypothetical protein